MKKIIAQVLLLVILSSVSYAADNYVQLPADSTGKKMRTVNQTIGANDVHQQGVLIGDPTTANIVSVDSSGRLTVNIAGGPVTETNIDGSGFIAVHEQGIAQVTLTVGNALQANQGTPATSTNGWPVKVTNGTTNAGVKAASTAAVAADPALVVAVSPNNTVGVTGTFWQATQPVSGTFWQATQPVSIASMPSTPVTGTFWQATQPVSGTFWQATQPVSSTQLPAALDGSGNLKTHEQGVARSQTTNAAGTQRAFIYPWGALMMVGDGSELFTESFDGAIDTTDRWNTAVIGGSGTVTASGSNLTIGTGTTASNAGALSSRATFLRRGFGFLKFGVGVKLESTVLANTHRFWGVGTQFASFTATTPLADAVGFEVKTDGNLYATIWNNNSEILATALTEPTDGNSHAYVIHIREDAVFWFIDDLENPVATSYWNGPSIATLPIRLHMINHTTPPGSAPTLVFGGIGVADSSNSNMALSDGQFGWRKATVKPASTAAAAADTSVIFQLNPSQPNLTTPLNVFDAADMTGTTPGTAPAKTTVIGGIYNSSAPAPSNGQTLPLQLDSAGNLKTVTTGGGNPCVNPSATLASVTGATSGTSATQIVALSGSTKIYVCSMTLVGVAGTTPTFSLVQGTGSNCGTGQTTVKQAVGVAAAAVLAYANPVAVGAAGNALCYLEGGTASPSTNYQITYVQQ